MTDLVSKRGTKSIVWDYFGFKKGTNGEIVDDETASLLLIKLCLSFEINFYQLIIGI